VVDAEAAAEAGVRDEAAPALADGGGAGEGRRLRGKAEQYLAEEVIVARLPASGGGGGWPPCRPSPHISGKKGIAVVGGNHETAQPSQWLDKH
jgi:hypothetical protein